ncbi:Phosducin domain-containing protein [Aphelenchoides fujianensis]|nr:Phosducin domain-containing protein [Aphelenchoides fujianensis]
MATLDEKYLDGPNVGYCSDSDEEPPQQDAPDLSREQQAPRGSQQSGPQTGAKGVLAEYRREQHAARFAAKAAEQRLIEEAERFALSSSQAAEQKPEDDNEEDELEAIRRRRLEQMQVRNAARIVEIEKKQEFLDAIEATKGGRRAFIHIYRNDLEVTETLNEALMDMAAQCTGCSFFKVQPKVLDMSSRFNKSALPTVQVYENEELVGNFVRISDSIGDDFDARDLRRFFAQNGITFESRN